MRAKIAAFMIVLSTNPRRRAVPASLLHLGWAALALLALGSGPLSANTAPPAKQTFEERVAETESALIDHELSFHRFAPDKRKRLIEFVIGNMLFVSTHEIGHGVLAEFELPNPAHDEDAADNFAILTTLNVGTDFSNNVLIKAAKGWYLADIRDKSIGEKPEYYDSHGLKPAARLPDRLHDGRVGAGRQGADAGGSFKGAKP
jgi:hypothetical protein